jgi:HD-GYP domain-containing protein (c-di-GMP phosphodiesterase class II)
LDIESRIVCVADIFTAITEDRPYRKGMCSENSLRVLKTMADNNGIDPELVSILEEFYDQINIIRIEAQAASESEYKSFRKNCSFL